MMKVNPLTLQFKNSKANKYIRKLYHGNQMTKFQIIGYFSIICFLAIVVCDIVE